MIPDWIPLLSIVVAIPALIISGITFSAARREKRFDLFLSLWEQYSTTDMLDALLDLYGLWRYCDGDPKRITNEYIRRVSDKGDRVLYDHRWKASLLFQKLAFL